MNLTVKQARLLLPGAGRCCIGAGEAGKASQQVHDGEKVEEKCRPTTPAWRKGKPEKISWADVDHPISKNHLGINLKSEDGPTYNSCLKRLKVYHISQLVHKHLQ